MFFRASVQSPGGTPPACPVLTCMMPRPPNLQLATAAGQVPSMLPPLQQYMLTGKADRNVMQLFGTASHVASAWVFLSTVAHLLICSVLLWARRLEIWLPLLWPGGRQPLEPRQAEGKGQCQQWFVSGTLNCHHLRNLCQADVPPAPNQMPAVAPPSADGRFVISMRSSQLPHDVEADEEVQVGIIDVLTGEVGSRLGRRAAVHAAHPLQQPGGRPGDLCLPGRIRAAAHCDGLAD